MRESLSATLRDWLLSPLNEQLGALMAAVDQLQARVQSLDAAVQANTAAAQGLINSVTGRVDALQRELATLRADDAVEDTKLTGLQGVIDGLNADVQTTTSALQSATPATPAPNAPQQTSGPQQGAEASQAPAPSPQPQTSGSSAESGGSGEQLAGEALQERARELEIGGRSSMGADELRDAIAEREGGTSTS